MPLGDAVAELGQSGRELPEEARVLLHGPALSRKRIRPEVRAALGEPQCGARSDAHDRQGHGEREALGDAQLGGHRSDALLQVHRHQAAAQTCDEIGDAARRAHVLLERGQEGDVPGSDCIARERSAERLETGAGVLVVPCENPRIERDAQGALFGRVGALHGLGGERRPARQGRSRQQRDKADQAH